MTGPVGVVDGAVAETVVDFEVPSVLDAELIVTEVDVLDIVEILLVVDLVEDVLTVDDTLLLVVEILLVPDLVEDVPTVNDTLLLLDATEASTYISKRFPAPQYS